MSFDQNLPNEAPKTGAESRGARPPIGPAWYPNAVSGTHWSYPHGDGYHWQVDRVTANGRVIDWKCLEDGRTARTEAMPTHPLYPRELTRQERLAKYHKLKAKRMMFFESFGRWPTNAEIGEPD
jgi:hypothetical protein